MLRPFASLLGRSHVHFSWVAALAHHPLVSSPRVFDCYPMAASAPLQSLRHPSDNPEIWRVAIRFLGDSEVPPSVISQGTVEVSPSASLHSIVQGIEHEGCLTPAVHGIQIMAYTSAPMSACMTARPTVGEGSRLGSPGSSPFVRSTPAPEHRSNHNLVGRHAASVREPMLTAQEHQFLAEFTMHVHQRLMRSRGTGPHSSEYAEASWLTTRAYIVRSLEDLRRPRLSSSSVTPP